MTSINLSLQGNKIITNIMNCIPHHRQAPKSVDSIVADVSTQLNIDFTLAYEYTKLVISFLEVFGIIVWHEGQLCQLGGQVERYFSNSLNWYFKNNQKLMVNWGRIGTATEIKINNLLESPQFFLDIMEQRRMLLSDKNNLILTPTRNQVVSVIMLNTKIRNKIYYLHQWDKDSKQYQIIGGKQKDSEDHFETAKRELIEELNNYDLVYNRDFVLKCLNQNSTPLRKLEISRTYGSLTAYEFWIYSVKFNRIDFNKSDMNRWISLDEMRKGITHDGKKVIDSSFYDENLTSGLEYIPISAELKKKIDIDFIEIKPRFGFVQFDFRKLYIILKNFFKK